MEKQSALIHFDADAVRTLNHTSVCTEVRATGFGINGDNAASSTDVTAPILGVPFRCWKLEYINPISLHAILQYRTVSHLHGRYGFHGFELMPPFVHQIEAVQVCAKAERCAEPTMGAEGI